MKIANVVDVFVPLTTIINNRVPDRIPPKIKNKVNKRNRLHPSNELKTQINCLNLEIKHFYSSMKKANVRKGIRPGNCKSLWTAVNMAKDKGSPEISNNMFLGSFPVSGDKA